MGTVSYLPGSRRPITDEGDAGFSHADEVPEATPNLPAIPEPLIGEVLPALPQRVGKDAKRLHRPTWMGVGPQARAAARTAAWQAVKDVCGRTWWEMWCGIPTRLWHLLRWFGHGTFGWIVLTRWIFAIDERADLRRPGVPPGRAVLIGAKANESWKLHGTIFLVANVGGWFAAWHFIPPGEIPWPEAWFVLTSAKIATILWATPWVVCTTVYGWLHDEKPPAPVIAPRAREDVDVASMNNALRAVGILEKPTAGNEHPDGVRLAGADTVGIGKETAWDLPDSCGKSNLDVIALRDRLAAAFATPRDQFHIEKGRHEAQFIVWQSKRDPFAGKAPEHPLLAVGQWSVWDPIPFAHDVRGRHALYSFVYVSGLTGSRPRRGKSMTVRSKLVGAVLDPTVRFHVFDGKGGGTWSALEPMADTFLAGSDEDDVRAAVEALERLVAEARARAKRIPGSKITRETAADPTIDAPITIIIIDEAQEYLTYPNKDWRERIERALFTLGKVGPSSGISTELITQRPDDQSLPTNLRSAFGSRFALAVMAYHDSNVILGPDQSKAGHDASKITKRGVGIYRPDDNADGEPDEDPNTTRLVRVFDMSDEVWEAVCERGVELRAENKPAAIEPASRIPDELLTVTDLFERLGTITPDLFRDNGIKTVNQLGTLLSKRKVPEQWADRQRVRSTRAVESAFALTPGCLTVVVPSLQTGPANDGTTTRNDADNDAATTPATTHTTGTED